VKLLRRYIPELLIATGGIILFIPFIGALHLFDWDEINFAESAREMILTGDYLTVRIDFIPFWEKPPLFIWFQVLSMKVFGINEFAARFPNTVCGIVTMIVLFRLGRKIYDQQFGYLWVLAYTGSLLPFLYFKSGIIDPWFNLFIFIGLVQFILMLQAEPGKERYYRVILSAVYAGLAILTKGPVGLLLFFLTVAAFWMINRFRLRIVWKEIMTFVVVSALVGSIWFIIQAVSGNYQLIVDFIAYQVRLFRTEDAGHGGFLLYHPVVLFLGVFPASVLALKSFKRNYYDDGLQKKFKIWMIILLIVVLVVFSAVRTKIVHYSSLAYFPVTYLAAYTGYKIINNHMRRFGWINLLVILIGTLYAMLIIASPFIMNNIEWIISSGRIKDVFAIGNLQADVRWSGWESVTGFVFIIGLMVFLILIRNHRMIQSYIFMFLNVTLFLYLALIFFTPRIEGYSQNALIEFCKERKNEDCYVKTLGMKSYAHLFYAAKKYPVRPESRDNHWLLEGGIDKPAYFIVRNKNAQEYLDRYRQVYLYREKNGFVFLKRDPVR
jgi:4-amino-4-deoxy-L-arabinose transferase-like glycosyltransferase